MQREPRRQNFFLRYAAGLLGLLLLTGCVTRGNVELLEARLRSQESHVRTLQEELDSAQVDLEVAQKEAGTLRSQLVSQDKAPLVSEDASVLYRTKRLQINKFLTGGLNQDDDEGDDVLNAVIVPVDAQGELVKVPGKIQMELFDMTQPKESQRIGVWEFEEKDSKKNWHHGFLISGYQFKLPWQTIPKNKQLLLHARLTTSDGRQFDVSEKVTVTLPESSHIFANEKPVPAAEPERLPQFPSRSTSSIMPQNNKNPFSKVSQEEERKPLQTKINTLPLGESPWHARKPNGQIPSTLKTSDRRSNPFYEAQKGTVIR